MSENIITGIDIGTNTIKVIVSDATQQSAPTILGIGTSKSNGLRNGYIVDLPQVVKSVSKALDNAVKSSRIRPCHAYLSIGGVSLGGLVTTGTTFVRNSDSTITERDFDKTLEDASANAEVALVNKKTIHDIPLYSIIDGEPALCDPVGMHATKLDTQVMLVHALESHIDDFVSAVEDAGVEVIDVTAGPLAASFAAVGTPQKMQGCIMLDIGAESTDIIVFENNTPIAMNIIPYGSNDVTNAIALELKVPTTEANQIKKGSLVGSKYNQTKVDKIVEKTMKKMFTEVKNLLKELGPEVILPAGVLITGGGARLNNIETLTRDALKLPVKTVYSDANKIAGNPEFTVAYGLCIWGANNEGEHSVLSNLKATSKKAASWFKQFLP